jgi:hypothetical protein
MRVTVKLSNATPPAITAKTVNISESVSMLPEETAVSMNAMWDGSI